MAAPGSKSNRGGRGPGYAELVRELREKGPDRVYLLCGEEDYLREAFFAELKKAVLGDEEDGFNLKLFRNPQLPLADLEEAVSAIPFFGDQTLVVVRDFDFTRCRDAEAERLGRILEEVPEGCTLVFISSNPKDIDARLASVKTLKKLGRFLEFSAQDQSQLTVWIRRRFSAQGKEISRENAEYLIFLSGALMNALILEIDKIASFSKGTEIQRSDIDAVATRIPEANIFEMTECLGQKNFDRAAALLADLLQDKEQHPIMLTAMIGMQMRRLYAASVALEKGLDTNFVMEVCGIRHEHMARRLQTAARGFGATRAGRGVLLCAEADYAMKSSSLDDAEILKDLFLKLAMGDPA